MNTVIISYWTGRSTRNLLRLLKQIHSYDAQAPFFVTIVCNGGDQDPLQLPQCFQKYNITILNRINAGYNIGAWDYGWRNTVDSDYFLFLQDECYIRKEGWLRTFLLKMSEFPRIGLVGETINWNKPWEELRNNPDVARCLNKDGQPKLFNSVDFLLDFLHCEGIHAGQTAEHLQSLVLFSSRSILQKIDGFLHKDIYAEAVGAEIAISKKVISLGYDIATVSNESFCYIGHPEWTHSRIRGKVKLFLKPFKAKLKTLMQGKVP